MQDRISTYPGRVTLVPVAGQENTYTLTRADDPTQVGTPLNKETLLSDETAAAIAAASGTTPETPSEALALVLQNAKGGGWNSVLVVPEQSDPSNPTYISAATNYDVPLPVLIDATKKYEAHFEIFGIWAQKKESSTITPVVVTARLRQNGSSVGYEINLPTTNISDTAWPRYAKYIISPDGKLATTIINIPPSLDTGIVERTALLGASFFPASGYADTIRVHLNYTTSRQYCCYGIVLHYRELTTA